MKTKIFLLLFISIYSLNTFSQGGVTFDESILRNSSSKFLKSPEVASMEQYGNYPVSEATGIPDISIPIYTIKTKDLEFPISISYHLGGIRVDDIPSCIGLGWTLNAGGALSRTIKGIADEDKDGGFLHSSKKTIYDTSNHPFECVMPLNESEFARTKDDESIGMCMEQGILGYYDTQSDIYNYQVYPISGSFVYNTNRELIHRPYSDNKIYRNKNDFTIYSDAGVKYLFSSNNVEYTYSNDSQYKTDINGFRHDKMNSGISSWPISSIISQNSTAKIEFEYIDGGVYDDMIDNWIVYYGLFPDSESRWNTQKGTQYVGSTISSREKLLNCIKFSDGKVEFKYLATIRKDKRKYSLDEIIIKDNNNNQIKKVKFSYSHFISEDAPLPKKKEDYRLKLNSIEIYGQQNSNPQTYSFQYNESITLPSYFATPADNNRRQYNKGQDYWGYFNGIRTNITLVGMIDPNLKKLFLGGEIANREPSEKHMKACILTKIIYPTGGYTVFQTEANRIYRNHILTIAGGLRIKSIQSFFANMTIPEKSTEYVYEDGEDILWPDYNCYTYKKINTPTEVFVGPTTAVYECSYYTENPITPIGIYSGSAVLYKKVTKLEASKETVNLSQKKYNGKIIYLFDSPIIRTGYSSSSGYQSPIRFSSEFVSWNTGKIRKQESYAIDNNGNFKKIEEINYKYNYSLQQVEIGQYINSKYNFFGILTKLPMDITRKKYFYSYWFNTCTGYSNLAEIKKVLYSSPQDSLITTTQFTYGNLLLQSKNRNALLTEKRIFDGSKVVKTNYLYPQDFNTSIYQIMRDNNILSPIIEQTTFSNDKRISKTKTNYSSFDNGLILPKSVQLIDNNNVPQDKIIYDKYDLEGNLVQYTKDGLTSVYLWGYKKQYPLAEVKNANYEQVTSIIAEATLKSISEKNEPSASDLTLISNLRTNQKLKNSHISTYSFKPLIGLLSFTNPSGIKMYYSYDSFGRLAETYFVKNGIQKIQSYDYHYQNPYY